MKNKKIYFIYFVILLLACNNPSKPLNPDSLSNRLQKQDSIDKKWAIINIEMDSMDKDNMDSLKTFNLLSLNDTAKWYLYNIYGGSIIPDIKDSIFMNFLSLKLRYYTFSVDKKNINLYYTFVYKNKPVEISSYGPIFRGVCINIKTKTIVHFFIEANGTATMDNLQSNFNVKNLDLSLLRTRKNELNEWYKNELIEHGVKLGHVSN